MSVGRREDSLFLCLAFYLGLNGWVRVIFVTQSTDSNASLSGNTQTHSEKVFYQLSGHPLAQSHWCIKLIMTEARETETHEGLSGLFPWVEESS